MPGGFINILVLGVATVTFRIRFLAFPAKDLVKLVNLSAILAGNSVLVDSNQFNRFSFTLIYY